MHREVIYDHNQEVVNDMTDESGNINRNSDKTNLEARKPTIGKSYFHFCDENLNQIKISKLLKYYL